MINTEYIANILTLLYADRDHIEFPVLVFGKQNAQPNSETEQQ